MPVKKYGIYLAFSPNENLTGQGLSEYIKRIIQSIPEFENPPQLVIACPSWHKPWLETLIQEAQIDKEKIEIISNFFSFLDYIPLIKSHLVKRFIKSIIGVFPILFKFIRVSPTLTRSTQRHSSSISSVEKKISKLNPLKKYFCLTTRRLHCKEKLKRSLRILREKICFFAFYQLIQKINQRKDVLAWYTPQPVWKSFCSINKPKIVCVPDVVYLDFPNDFEKEFFGDLISRIQFTIKSNKHFIVYSQNTKQETLIKHFKIEPKNITVIPHGASNLYKKFTSSAALNTKTTEKEYCHSLFLKAFSKMQSNIQPGITDTSDLQFIFYASQARPHKNLFNLIKAYHQFRNVCYFKHKLILTCNPKSAPNIINYLEENQLTTDVIFLCGLTDLELYACYHFANLTICPTLFEGGFPFSFDESLCAQTPIVMSDIAVTREVITDSDLQKIMLFDPYDLKSMANRIHWGIQNSELLLEKQLPIYQERAKRTYAHVAKDIFDAMEKISLS